MLHRQARGTGPALRALLACAALGLGACPGTDEMELGEELAPIEIPEPPPPRKARAGAQAAAAPDSAQVARDPFLMPNEDACRTQGKSFEQCLKGDEPQSTGPVREHVANLGQFARCKHLEMVMLGTPLRAACGDAVWQEGDSSGEFVVAKITETSMSIRSRVNGQVRVIKTRVNEVPDVWKTK